MDFVQQQYPEMLSVFQGYPNAILRADAARYFLLDHFGGVYADLDTECLRPIEPLLAEGDLLLPLEPEEHLDSRIVKDAKLKRVVGNAWIASVPGHDFWKRVIARLPESRGEPNPLSATGPFFLTRLIAESLPEEMQPRLLPSSRLFPATNQDTSWLKTRKPGATHGFSDDVYCIHYWDGSWWRRSTERTKAHLLHSMRPVLTGLLDESVASALVDSATPTPLVSCLMVTGRRPALAELAMRCFSRQTYPNRELIVIDDSGTDALAAAVERHDGGPGATVRWLRLPPEGKPLGALRNIALAEARGEYLCQWDDDDLSAPERLQRQTAALLATGADACAPASLQLWWPSRDWISESSNRIWECALMWKKGSITAYPELRAGEDTPPVEALAKAGRVVLLEAPDLYTYVHHGENTFSDEHWMKLWSASRRKAVGETCRLRLGLMQERLPCREYIKVASGTPLP